MAAEELPPQQQEPTVVERQGVVTDSVERLFRRTRHRCGRHRCREAHRRRNQLAAAS